VFADKSRFSIAFVVSVWVHLFFTLFAFLYHGSEEPLKVGKNEEKTEMLKMVISKNQEKEKKTNEAHEGGEDGEEAQKIRRKSSEEFEKEFQVKGEWKDLVKNLSQNSSLRQQFPETFDNINTNSGAKESYIFRKRHYEDLVVKEVFPTLKTIEKPFEQILRQAPKDLEKYAERNEIIEKYRKWTEGEIVENRPKVQIVKKTSQSRNIPLEFPHDSRRKYFDSTLRETKETQLYNFIERYFRYDPNRGDLPVAVRELYYDNLQRIVYSFSPDPTYLDIDYFDENLNKEDFLRNALSQASRLKGTKTQTELLFAIQDIYEIQQKAWAIFFDFQNLYQSYTPEQRKKLRYETLRRIVERYKPVLEQKKIHNYQDAVKVYSKKREEISDYMLKYSPGQYRKADILFEKGRIHWDLGSVTHSDAEKAAALQIWKTIQNDPALSGDANFVNKGAMERLIPILDNYDKLQNVGIIEGHVQSILDQNKYKRINEKMKREEKILWPK